MAARSGAAGFTLVELLVVLAIFSLISLLLFGGFHFETGVAASGTERLDRTDEIALASGFLRNQLADIRPFPLPGARNAAAVAFDGEPGGLAFVSAPPAYLSPGGFQELRIAVEAAHGERQLTLRWQPRIGGDAADIAEASPSVLLDRIAGVDFAYFGSAAAGESPAWHDRWNGATGLPALIRLRIAFPGGYAAPDLIVAPRPAEPAFQ